MTTLQYEAAVYPVGAAEIADRLKVKPQTVHTWRQRDILPAPRWMVSRQPAWDWAEIEKWAMESGRLSKDYLYEGLLSLEGIGWEGNLEEMRSTTVTDDPD